MERPHGSYIGHFSNLVKAHGGINLAQGIPGHRPPAELLDALAQVLRTDAHQYAPGQGDAQLLQLVAQRYGLAPDNVLMVQGGTEGLSLAYTYIAQLLGPDMAVMGIAPAYESHSHLPRIFGHRYVSFAPEPDGRLDMDRLASDMRRERIGLLFVASPGNPHGRALSKQQVLQLLGVAQRTGAYVVFDAVYHELYFEQPPYVPTDQLGERLFIVGSFSKSLCITGWRVGYLLHHASHASGLRSVHDYVGLCASAPMQRALAIYLADAQPAERYAAELRARLAAAYSGLSDHLRGLGFGVPPTDGGCFVWAELPQHLAADGFELASTLYEQQRVAVVPGEHFGSSYARWLRLNIARPADELHEAKQRLAQFFADLDVNT